MRFETDEFVRSHGKQPKGFGVWAFRVSNRVQYADGCKDEQTVVFTPRAMTASEAKYWMKRAHISRDTYRVEVMP